MKMKKNILVFLMALLISFSLQAKEDSVNIYKIPRAMPKLDIVNEQGQSISLKKFKGNFVLMIVWSKNCTPCVKELDNLNGFVNKTKSDKIKVIMLSSDKEWNSASEQRLFVNKFKGQDLDLYTDRKGQMAEALGIFTSPHTVLINSKGEEIGRIRGSAEWDNDKVIDYIKQIKEKHG